MLFVLNPLSLGRLFPLLLHSLLQFSQIVLVKAVHVHQDILECSQQGPHFNWISIAGDVVPNSDFHTANATLDLRRAVIVFCLKRLLEFFFHLILAVSRDPAMACKAFVVSLILYIRFKILERPVSVPLNIIVQIILRVMRSIVLDCPFYQRRHRENSGDKMCGRLNVFCVSFAPPGCICQILGKFLNSGVQFHSTAKLQDIAFVHQEQKAVIEAALIFFRLTGDFLHESTNADIVGIICLDTHYHHWLCVHFDCIQCHLFMQVHTVHAGLGTVHARSVDQNDLEFVRTHTLRVQMRQVCT